MELNDFNGKKRSVFGYFMAGLAGAIVGGFLLLMFGPGVLFSKFPQGSSQNQPVGEIQKISSTTTTSAITDIGYAAGKVMPSVVGIVRPIEGKNKTKDGMSAEIGTGVIVDSAGFILTNNHVADLSKDLTISLYDGRNVTGKSVWADPILDFSIIKINEPNLAVANLGNSRNIKIGDTAIAIGNPLGLKFQRSVTSGIISALDRTVQLSANTYMEDLIQTDASINPGNSGGPLININGEVVGINTVKVATAEGMGFAIPINIAKPIIKSIKTTGKFVEPVLGIEGIDMNMIAYTNYSGYKIDRGILVGDCIKDSPAYNAGISKGDTILAVGGKNIDALIDLKEYLYNIGSNNIAVLNILKANGTQQTLNIKLVPFKVK